MAASPSDTGPATLTTPIQAAIFDAGGVLIENHMAHVWEDVLATLELDRAAWSPVWRELGPLLGSGQLEEAGFWQQVLERTGARGSLPEESLFVREYSRRWATHQDVFDLILRLKALGLRTAVLSNTITAHVSHNRIRGLYDPFDVHVFSNEVGLNKPDPAIYRLTLERLGLADTPGAALFVDDLQENVDAANAVGIHGILFTSAAQLTEDVRRLGVPL
jgi:epoxide hydrolase-like predicted phosphatase